AAGPTARSVLPARLRHRCGVPSIQAPSAAGLPASAKRRAHCCDTARIAAAVDGPAFTVPAGAISSKSRSLPAGGTRRQRIKERDFETGADGELADVFHELRQAICATM